MSTLPTNEDSAARHAEINRRLAALKASAEAFEKAVIEGRAIPPGYGEARLRAAKAAQNRRTTVLSLVGMTIACGTLLGFTGTLVNPHSHWWAFFAPLCAFGFGVTLGALGTRPHVD